MAIKSDQVAVGTEKVAIHHTDEDGAQIIIKADKDVFIGNGDMTVDSGFLLKKNVHFRMSIGPGEVLYAMVASDPATLYYVMTLNQ